MNDKNDSKKQTLAERAGAVNGELVLRDFAICDPDEDDNGMFTLQKTFVDGSGIEWPIALSMETILRLCEAEGIDLGDVREHVFRKAPIRVVAWSYELSESFCYAYCDFPGPDATETDLEAVKVPENEGRDADEDGFGEEEP
jgi:hypothetical protein